MKNTFLINKYFPITTLLGKEKEKMSHVNKTRWRQQPTDEGVSQD
jgi:hypothetical protein